MVCQEFLVNFLQEETFPYSKELLVMHYLQKGRYVEGIRLNELLKKDKKVCMKWTLFCTAITCFILMKFLKTQGKRSKLKPKLFLSSFHWLHGSCGSYTSLVCFKVEGNYSFNLVGPFGCTYYCVGKTLMSRIECKYCLISTSYLTGLFDIIILLHIWQNCVCFGDLLLMRTHCDVKI